MLAFPCRYEYNYPKVVSISYLKHRMMKANAVPSPSIDAFVERLVQEKGLGNLDPEALAQVQRDLASRAEDRVNAVILSKLPEGDLAAFEKLLDEGSAEDIHAFCAKKIPDLDQIIAAELLAFRQTYLTP